MAYIKWSKNVFDLGCIRVQGVYVLLVADKHINSICRLYRSLTVAPNTSYVCCARVKGSSEAEGGSELLVQSFDDHMICNQPGVELDESVVKLGQKNSQLVFQIILTGILGLRSVV